MPLKGSRFVTTKEIKRNATAAPTSFEIGDFEKCFDK